MPGSWAAVHEHARPFPYGDDTTYRLAARYLQECERVEDWGCGPGWFKQFLAPGQVVGVDGSPSPAVDKVRDLVYYTSETEGLLLRHVLEHNELWRQILNNAMRSFTRRMVLVLFTPMATLGEGTRQIAWNPGYGVPDIAFTPWAISDFFPARTVVYRYQDLSTETQYGVERIYYVERTRD